MKKKWGKHSICGRFRGKLTNFSTLMTHCSQLDLRSIRGRFVFFHPKNLFICGLAPHQLVENQISKSQMDKIQKFVNSSKRHLVDP